MLVVDLTQTDAAFALGISVYKFISQTRKSSIKYRLIK